MEAVGSEWLSLLTSLPTQPAHKLYQGRSVRDAERAALRLRADLLFASAGLGWVPSDQPVPSYGMTVVAGDDNVLARIRDSLSAAEWWRWLNVHSPFATRFADAVAATQGPVLVALPRAYLAMVEEDLLSLSSAEREKLRIIQRGAAIRESLRPWSLLYDDRLEGSADYAGTRSDFPARAACHFVEQVFPTGRERDAIRHNEMVQEALTAWTAPASPIRSRRSDGELRDIVAQHWDSAGGRATVLLRILRDDLGIACEQGRFARLITAMRAERELAG